MRGARCHPECPRLADQISQSGGKAICRAADVTDEAYAKALADIAKRHGGAAAVIHRAEPLIVGRKPGQRSIKAIPIQPSPLPEILNFWLKKSQLFE